MRLCGAYRGFTNERIVEVLCAEQTHRLNCDCCEPVVFICDLEKGHDGDHHDENNYFTGMKQTIVVTWKNE